MIASSVRGTSCSYLAINFVLIVPVLDINNIFAIQILVASKKSKRIFITDEHQQCIQPFFILFSLVAYNSNSYWNYMPLHTTTAPTSSTPSPFLTTDFFLQFVAVRVSQTNIHIRNIVSSVHYKSSYDRLRTPRNSARNIQFSDMQTHADMCNV